MSVPKSERSVSQMEYLRQLRLLEKDLLKISANKPKKFRFFIETAVLTPMIEAMNAAKAGSVIQSYTKEDIELRHRYMYLAYCNIHKIASQVEIFFDLYKTDGLTINQIEDLSIKINFCQKLLKEVIDHDKEEAKKRLGE
jgi:hypothetical protein